MKMFFIIKRLGAKEDRAIYCFDKTTVLIGTEFGDLIVNNGEISETQALLYFRPDGTLIVRDLSLAAGTYVNGVRIREKTLASGDHIRVGDLSMEFLGAEVQVSGPAKGLPFQLLEHNG